MPIPQGKLHTIDDIYNLPEGTRAELLDGQIYYMAPPSRQHQEIVGEIYAAVHGYIKENKGDCKTYIAPFAVFLNEDDANYVEPDINIICSPDKLTYKGCKGSPDWIIEVVSPGSRRMDYYTKLSLPLPPPTSVPVSESQASDLL